MEYLDKGYLPEAITNFLALIGWGYDESTEIMTREELIERFDLTRISPSGGVFNVEKLNKFNGIYIRSMGMAELLGRILPYLQRAGLLSESPGSAELARIEGILPLVQERIVVLSDAVDLLRPFFEAPVLHDPALLVPKKLDVTATQQALGAAAAVLADLESWEVPALEARLRALALELGLKPGDVFMMLRVAVTGRTVSLPLVETLHALGHDETLARIERARAILDGRR
jgi:glutamyl-tRNA synthetase